MQNLLNEPEHRRKVDVLQERLMRAVAEAGDPVMDAVHKLLGRWERPSGQIDASRVRNH